MVIAVIVVVIGGDQRSTDNRRADQSRLSATYSESLCGKIELIIFSRFANQNGTNQRGRLGPCRQFGNSICVLFKTLK